MRRSILCIFAKDNNGIWSEHRGNGCWCHQKAAAKQVTARSHNWAAVLPSLPLLPCIMHPTTFSLDNCLLRQEILVPLSFSASNQQWLLKRKEGPSIQRVWLLEDDLIFIKKRERDPKNVFSHQTKWHHVHCTSIFVKTIVKTIGWESLFSQAEKALVLFSDYASCSRNHIEFVFISPLISLSLGL